MSKKERSRLLVCSRVRDQHMSLKTAASVVNISYRQMRRVWRRFCEEGDAGLVHRSRGRPSGRGYSREFKEGALRRYAERYEGFGPTLAAEKLAQDGYSPNHETLRRWLLEAGLIAKRKKRAKHRSCRERRAHFGELVQMDGSHHRWFEDRGGQCCLMEMIDDATGTRLALVGEQETTADAMRLLWDWIKAYGVPEALYTDQKTVYVTDREPTIEEQLKGAEPLTAFGQACADLGIGIIAANSPEAKGRVERAHGVLQDRFVKELRLENAGSIEEANRILSAGFIVDLNDRFATPPIEGDHHRGLRRDEDLAAIFSARETRSLARDYTIKLHGRTLQIQKQPGLPRPATKITVATYLDGSLHLRHKDRDLLFKDITEQQQREAPAKRQVSNASHAHTPPPDHPWRKSENKRIAIKAAMAAKAR